MNTLVETLEYFVFITFELIALFLLISAAVEIILMYIPQDKIRQWLSGRGILDNVIALVIGGAGMAMPEMTMLANIFHKKLVIMIITAIFFTAVIVGYLFNILL